VIFLIREGDDSMANGCMSGTVLSIRRPRGKILAGFGCVAGMLACLCAASLPAQVGGSDLADRIQALERQGAELNRRLTQAPTGNSPAVAPSADLPLEARVSALENHVQRLLEQFPSSAEPPTATAPPPRPAGPSAAASPPQASPSPLQRLETRASSSEETRLPVAGYMELNFTNPQQQPPPLDFRRFVKFSSM